MVVNPLHGYFRQDHLDHVVVEMRRRGAPKIRAFYDAEVGVWHAREGTHRLRAAAVLGLLPELVSVPWNKTRAALYRARIAADRHAHVFEFDDNAAGRRALVALENAASARRAVAEHRTHGVYDASYAYHAVMAGRLERAAAAYDATLAALPRWVVAAAMLENEAKLFGQGG
jgi:hypothetical protein